MDAETKKEVVEKRIYDDCGCGYGYGYGYNRGGRWATKGEALGVGIPALALGGIATAGMLFGRGRFGLGGNSPENVNIVTGGAAGSSAAPTAFQAWEKSCEDAIALTNAMWAGQLATERQMYAHRQTDVAEKFGLYKSQMDADFGLYKSQRDLYDVLNERYANKFNELDKKVAVLEATRPYQDRLIQCEIDRAYTAAINHTDRRTCRMIEGQVVLPSTPTVTGYGSVSRCVCPQQAAAPSQAA